MSYKNSTLEERVQWLLKHPNFLGQMYDVIFRAMQRDGLFAKTTYSMDCRSGIIEAVTQAQARLLS